MSATGRRLGLPGYYLVEGLNALGTNVYFLGVFFHARLSHGFSDMANLMLAVTQGAAYVLATRAGGRFADRVGPDRAIACGLAGMCLALALGWWAQPAWALFVGIGAYSASTALTWPALESAIAGAPGKTALARRTGLYNVTWSFVGAAGFFISGSFFELDPDTVFWVPLAAHALELAYLAARTRGALPRTVTDSSLPSAAGHEPGNATPAGVTAAAAAPEGAEPPWRRPPEGSASGGPGRAPEGGAQRQDPAAGTGAADLRSRYLRSARIANGLNYFLFGAYGALAPTMGARLGLDARLAIWLVSSYLFARGAAFVLFWLWEGWEYRPAWLAASLVLPPAALALLFATRSPGVAMAALALLGVLSGLAYSASLHASLDRDGGHGEGGGFHEWVIGIGVLAGPLAGAAGVSLLGGAAGAGGMVACLGATTALVGLAPLAGAARRGR